jgi:multiple sugar transport system permease protein
MANSQPAATLERRGTLGGWAFVAFPLAIVFLFTALPTVAGVALSLYEWSGGGLPRFVGFQNFVRAGGDPALGHALRNTLIFAIISVPLTILLAFPLAAALHADWFRGRTLLRAVFILPLVVSIVAIGLIWRWVLESSDGGLLNGQLTWLVNLPHSLGLSASPVAVQWPKWLGNSWWGLGTLIAVSTWRGLGFAVVMYLAALGNVPQASLDAAAVDGAGPWQTLWRVSWPSVRPMSVFLLITGMIGALQVFDIVLVMIGTFEQPHTDVLNLYLYREFGRSRLGYAATIGVVVLLATLLVTSLELWWQRGTASGSEA